MEEVKPDNSIDLHGEMCPINFVKTKLALEAMESGQVLEVFIDDGDPMRNVPRSIKEEGHQIIDVKKIGEGYRLLIRRA
ncbi:MAG: sulfurtransferase TusA family protein [Candidatus Omnitrophica bacterium]|nr:sulfurtransferase TusA family protein [Candidatus Omnitrophota bacterium]